MSEAFWILPHVVLAMAAIQPSKEQLQVVDEVSHLHQFCRIKDPNGPFSSGSLDIGQSPMILAVQKQVEVVEFGLLPVLLLTGWIACGSEPFFGLFQIWFLGEILSHQTATQSRSCNNQSGTGSGASSALCLGADDGCDEILHADVVQPSLIEVPTNAQESLEFLHQILYGDAGLGS